MFYSYYKFQKENIYKLSSLGHFIVRSLSKAEESFVNMFIVNFEKLNITFDNNNIIIKEPHSSAMFIYDMLEFAFLMKDIYIHWYF